MAAWRSSGASVVTTPAYVPSLQAGSSSAAGPSEAAPSEDMLMSETTGQADGSVSNLSSSSKASEAAEPAAWPFCKGSFAQLDACEAGLPPPMVCTVPSRQPSPFSDLSEPTVSKRKQKQKLVAKGQQHMALCRTDFEAFKQAVRSPAHVPSHDACIAPHGHLDNFSVMHCHAVAAVASACGCHSQACVPM